MSEINYASLSPDKNDAIAQLLHKMVQAQATSLGEFGSIRVADTNEHEGPFRCIIPNTDAVFTELLGNSEGNEGVTCPAGIPIYGKFTAFTLTSGDVTAYYSETPEA